MQKIIARDYDFDHGLFCLNIRDYALFRPNHC